MKPRPPGQSVTPRPLPKCAEQPCPSRGPWVLGPDNKERCEWHALTTATKESRR